MGTKRCIHTLKRKYCQAPTKQAPKAAKMLARRQSMLWDDVLCTNKSQPASLSVPQDTAKPRHPKLKAALEPLDADLLMSAMGSGLYPPWTC